MDENTARLVEQLKRNPAQLQDLLRSPDGQALMQMLNQSNQGAEFQNAARSASNGDPAEAMKLVNQYLKTPSGAALAKRIQKTFGK